MSSSWGLSATTEIDYLFSFAANSAAQFDNLANNALSRGIDRFTEKDYAGATTEFRRSIGLSPSSANAPKAYEYLALAYLQLGKNNEAIRTNKEASKAFPSDDGFHLRQGDIFFKLGHYNEAITEYTQAAQINPASPDNRYSLGLAYLSAGRLKEAQKQFIQVTQLAPASPVGYFGQGQVFRASGQYENALVLLKKAVKMDSKFANAFLELGYTYTDMENVDQAQKQLEILQRLGASSQSTNLQGYMVRTAEPKIILAYSPNGFGFLYGPGTMVSELDSTLSSANGHKDFTMSFTFSKDMDINSVESFASWQISRQSGDYFRDDYNFGMPVPSTEVNLPMRPTKVVYNPQNRTALVTFQIMQNNAGNGTIDPSHISFTFNGLDTYGKTMDPIADEYSGFSVIV